MSATSISNIDKIFIFVHDGVFHATSGAGNSNKRFIEVLTKIYPTTTKFICPIYADVKGNSYNKVFYERMHKLITNSNGVVIPISNSTGGEHIFGDITNWKEVERNCFKTINQHCNEKDRVLVISFDTAFAGLLSKLGTYSNIAHVHIPRSTGLIQNKDDLVRIKFENRMFKYVNKHKNSYIGCTSPFMKHHLEQEYGVRKEKLLDITNGVLLDRVNKKLDQNYVLETEKKIGIPEKTKYVMAYGRAEEYKGYHILLQALSLIELKNRPFFFIIAVEYLPNSDYVIYLKQIIENLKLKGYLSTLFDATLPGILQQSPNLLAVVVPSLEEPFGLIPIENMAIPYGKAPVIAADTGGLKKQIVHKKTGFLFERNNPTDLAKQIVEVRALSDNAKQIMKKEGYSFVKSNYNYEKNIRNFLVNLGKRWQKANE